MGLTDEMIAMLVLNPDTERQITVKTLYKHFRRELDTGKASTKVYVFGKLMKLIDKEVPAAIIFFLKTQCGWSERSVHELTGPNGTSLTEPADPQTELDAAIDRLAGSEGGQGNDRGDDAGAEAGAETRLDQMGPAGPDPAAG